MIENYSCKICSNELGNNSFIVKEMMLGMKEEFTYFQCSDCNCLQIAVIPKNIPKYYPAKNYYSYNLSAKKSSSSVISSIKGKINRVNIFPKSIFDRGLRVLFPNWNINFLNGLINSDNIKILDVGCGDGHKFLYPLYEAGFTNILGCDPFIEKETVYENGLKIWQKEMDKIGGQWDIIIMNHSFEHISNPKETVKYAYKMLAPGGVCIIRIPTSSSFAWKHYGVDWFQLDAPRHFFLHSVESIKLLAIQFGFVFEKMIFDSTHHQFTLSERYKQGKTLQERTNKSIFGRVASIFKKINYSSKAKTLNRNNEGDQAIFYLKKSTR